MRKKRKAVKKSSFSNFYNDYEFELKLLLSFGLGTFLLLENFEIKLQLLHFFNFLVLVLQNFILAIIHPIRDAFQTMQTSDLVGILFILYGLFISYKKLKIRLIQRHIPNVNCIKCGESSLKRIHKNKRHSLIEAVFVVKVKNLMCKDCGFKSYQIIEH